VFLVSVRGMAVRNFLLNHRTPVLTVAVLLFGGIVLFLHHTQATSPTVATRDAKRISDLQQVQSELENYFNKCGYYPGGIHPGAICALWVSNNTWTGMSAALTDSHLGISNIPNDPTLGTSYLFGTKLGGRGYTLGAVLEDPTNPSLAQSVHGTVNNIDCSGSMYCIHVSK
jgi:hypothetical protein